MYKNKQSFLKINKNKCKNNKPNQILMNLKSINKSLPYIYIVFINSCYQNEKNNSLIKILKGLKKKVKNKKCVNSLKKN